MLPPEQRRKPRGDESKELKLQETLYRQTNSTLPRQRRRRAGGSGNQHRPANPSPGSSAAALPAGAWGSSTGGTGKNRPAPARQGDPSLPPRLCTQRLSPSGAITGTVARRDPPLSKDLALTSTRPAAGPGARRLRSALEGARLTCSPQTAALVAVASHLGIGHRVYPETRESPE